MFRTFSVLAGLLGLAAILFAQAIDPDTFKVNYFSNIGTGLAPSQVRMTNVGTSGGDICADIYVFDPNQELQECCSCRLTPDGLLTLSIGPLGGDIAANPLTGDDPPLLNGLIEIVPPVELAPALAFPFRCRRTRYRVFGHGPRT